MRASRCAAQQAPLAQTPSGKHAAEGPTPCGPALFCMVKNLGVNVSRIECLQALMKSIKIQKISRVSQAGRARWCVCVCVCVCV